MKDVLDALMDEALVQASRRKVKPLPDKKNRLEQLKESFHSMYTNPENWVEGKAVALIHKAADGHQTLLGAFKEFQHKRTKARKLCRSPEPMSITCEEYVTGDWWVHSREVPHWPENPEHAEIREFRFDLELGELQVFAKDAPIKVCLKNGWVCKVLLTEQTQFVCPTNKIFIHFPAELDILDGMSFENKMSLRTRLGL